MSVAKYKDPVTGEWQPLPMGGGGGSGAPGVGIVSVEQTETSAADGGTNVVTVTLSDGKTATFQVKNGSKGSSGDAGKDGADGKDGTSVTVKSVNESTADGGINVITFSDGKTINIKNGSQGSAGKDGTNGKDGAAGKDGKTPVRGTDYWTPEDKAEVINSVLASIQGTFWGEVDANNNIILSGVLAGGTYTIKYEDAEGGMTSIGTLKIGSGGVSGGETDEPTTNYTNLFDPDAATLNARYSVSSGTMSSSGTGMVLTDFIPVTIAAGETKILRIRGASFTGTNSATFYFKTKSSMNPPTNKANCGMGVSTHAEGQWGNVYTDENGDAYIKLGYINSTKGNSATEAFDSAMTATTYIRLQIYISDSTITKSDIENIIITIDEPITD